MLAAGMERLRTRTVTWDDPDATAKLMGTMSGLDLLRLVVDGKAPAPPIARTLDFALVEVGEGRAVFEVVPQEFHYNPTGQVHGGLAATVLDSALGCAVLSTCPASMGYTTIELHLNLTRAISDKTGKLRCEARIVHSGRTIRTSEATLKDASGKLYAHATSTCLVFDTPS
jgi:uncharacterized protein (TIGR00369 family)